LNENKLANPIHGLPEGAEVLMCLFGMGGCQRRADNPKFILLDLKRTKVDWREGLQRLTSHPNTQIIPVVVFTSSREEQGLLTSYRLGTNRYEVNPIDFDHLHHSPMTEDMPDG
jgi:two-component system response regulator